MQTNSIRPLPGPFHLGTTMATTLHRRPAMSPSVLLLFGVTYILIADNKLLWHSLFDIIEPRTPGAMATIVAIAAIIGAAFTLVLAPFAHRRIVKPLLSSVIVVAAVVGWFQQEFGTIVDEAMIASALETDAAEAGELLGWPFFRHLLLYAGLPCMVIAWIRIRPARTLIRGMARYAASFVLAAVVLVAGAWAEYKNIAVLGREHTELRMMINPSYAMFSTWKVFANAHAAAAVAPIPVGTDAVAMRGAGGRPRVVVLVVGETARADHFSLNGYSRPTNPALSRLPLINYSRASACGTSTAVSVPCMFSHLDRDTFDAGNPRRYENLLDVLSHAGVKTLWRDNNTGCKGLCDDVEYTTYREGSNPGFCGADGCVDEVLLDGLAEKIEAVPGDLFVVLHQNGSHGPAYHRRYPERFKVFEPQCESDAPQSCAVEELVNSYDNTIRYTDYFLSRVIELLTSLSDKRDVAMLYASDHGESLGEHGVYLHGLPYLIAPRAQTRVPMLLWMSSRYLRDAGIEQQCLQASSDEPVAHDHLFHSVLGLFDIRSGVHRDQLDLLARCRQPDPRKDSIASR